MSTHLLFTAELIGAINLWMISPSPAAAQRIDLAAVDLPDQFKTRTEPVFRKIDLAKEHVWDLMAEERLKETISSWTFSESVAKSFNNGVPPVGWQGVIFKIDPSRGRTVLNISGLFATPGFTQAIEAHRPTMPNLEHGIDQFRDSEREALVEIDELLPNDIYSLGGYSSSRSTLLEMAGHKQYGHAPTPTELVILEAALTRSGHKLGPSWCTEQQTLNVRNRLDKRIPILRQLKQFQESAKLKP